MVAELRTKSLLPCSICTKTFTSRNELDNHTKICDLNKLGKKESKSRAVSCPVCRKKMKKRVLTGHMLVHSEHRPFSCSICEKSFKRSSTLRQHMDNHNDTRRFSCSSCKKSFSRIWMLNRHNLIHLEDKPVSCTICTKTFRLKQHLNRHMATHSEDRPFICSICKKTFKFKESLTRHMIIHSTGPEKRPYNCSICGMSFREERMLKRHMVTHSDKRPFICSTCKKSFKHKRSLTQHLTICRKSFKVPSNMTQLGAKKSKQIPCFSLGSKKLRKQSILEKIARLRRCISKMVNRVSVKNETQRDEAVVPAEEHVKQIKQQKEEKHDLNMEEDLDSSDKKLDISGYSEHNADGHAEKTSFNETDQLEKDLKDEGVRKMLEEKKDIEKDMHSGNDEQQEKCYEDKHEVMAEMCKYKEKGTHIVQANNEYYNLDPPAGWKLWKNWEDWDNWKNTYR